MYGLAGYCPFILLYTCLDLHAWCSKAALILELSSLAAAAGTHATLAVKEIMYNEGIVWRAMKLAALNQHWWHPCPMTLSASLQKPTVDQAVYQHETESYVQDW